MMLHKSDIAFHSGITFFLFAENCAVLAILLMSDWYFSCCFCFFFCFFPMHILYFPGAENLSTQWIVNVIWSETGMWLWEETRALSKQMKILFALKFRSFGFQLGECAHHCVWAMFGNNLRLRQGKRRESHKSKQTGNHTPTRLPGSSLV